MSIPFLLDENPTVLPVGSDGDGREVRERFLVASLARIQGERRCRLVLASGFRLLRLSGIDRLDEPGSAAGRGSAGPDG